MLKTWRLVAVLLLCLGGGAISVYLTGIHLRHLITGAASACNVNDTLNCDLVNNSAYSEVFAVPVSHLAALFYAGLAIVSLLSFGSTERRRVHGVLLIGALLSGGVSLFLAGVSLFVLHALCIFCAALYATNVALLALLAAGGGAALRELFAPPAKRPQDSRRLLTIAAIGAFVLGALVSIQAIRQATTMAHAAAAARQSEKSAPAKDTKTQSARVDLVDSAAPTIGPAAAPVTLVEVSDFECPFCQRASSTVAELRRLYPDKLRVVFRNFPLDMACNPRLKHPIHENACAAARAAYCAGQQGQFWPYAERLFGGATEAADLIEHVEKLKLDKATFNACTDSPAAAARIAADIEACSQAGVTGVPVFFINGRLLAGAVPIEKFREIIDEELRPKP